MTDALLISHVSVLDGTGAAAFDADVQIGGGRIVAVAAPGSLATDAGTIDGRGLTLAPGFIDAHTHDDLVVIDRPAMLPKVTQGVTTVVVGNCGISAGLPLPSSGGDPPDPMALLGPAAQFCHADFAAYRRAVDAARPAVNVAALVGHTALRARHMDRLDRPATLSERRAMCDNLAASLDAGALGLSTGLAYGNAAAAPTDEVLALAEMLRGCCAIYCTHVRSEGAEILPALDEAFAIGRYAAAPVIVSHLKCAGVSQHGRSAEILARFEAAAVQQPVGCDCYPYTASASTLDLQQVVPETPIFITWSDPKPAQAGRMLADIAAEWQIDLRTAAQRLQPAGAIYHCMADGDVDRILAHPLTMIGSDGLPCDPRPHPRLWGSFPRVLGHYVRDRGLLSLPAAIRKMTGLPADRFGFTDRGYVRAGLAADLILFDPATIADRATYADPVQPAAGIVALWVNGVRTLDRGGPTTARAGRFLPRAGTDILEGDTA